MATIGSERVLTVHHWNETVFSFTTTRDGSLRFENGHFVMMGLLIEGKPLMRAYSIASANHEEFLEFSPAEYKAGRRSSREPQAHRYPLVARPETRQAFVPAEFRHRSRPIHEH